MTDWFEGVESTMDKKQEISEAAEAWKPKAGEVLKGTFLSATTKATTSYGGGYVVTIQQHETDLFVEVWGLRTVLKKELQESQPAVGSLIAIRYDGMVEPESGGHSYGKYVVECLERDAEYWLPLIKEMVALDANKEKARVGDVDTGFDNPFADKKEEPTNG